MDKKQTILVICRNSPSPALAEAIARMEGGGLTVVVQDLSDSHSDAIKGHEADLTIYTEACPVRCDSEALSRLLNKGKGNKRFHVIESRDSRERTDTSK